MSGAVIGQSIANMRRSRGEVHKKFTETETEEQRKVSAIALVSTSGSDVSLFAGCNRNAEGLVGGPHDYERVCHASKLQSTFAASW